MARILVIEDNSATLETYGAMLRTAAHEVGLAATTHDGLGLSVRPL
jgi:CheY-like chemotaxis protein